MQLAASDVQSETWRKIKTHYAQRLATLRSANDQRLPLDETEFIRGQIQECKNVLDLEPST